MTMLNTTPYQELGHDMYVELLERTGATVSKEIRKAKRPASHKYEDCQRPWNCSAHRRQYRKSLDVRKEQQRAERERRTREAFYASLSR